MARRSSARLRGRNSSTPKRVSLSHDAQPQTPRTAPVKLSTLEENDEMPGAFPNSASPPTRFARMEGRHNIMHHATPTNTTPIQPAEEEMHPKQHQQSTAKPLEEARWLGFSGMHPQTEPPKQSNKIANLQATPTKANATAAPGSPKIRFTFNREQSLELSPAAKRLMEETRGEAARIREQMVASGEAEPEHGGVAARKIATPKSRKGRFSDAHKAEFNKMDSISSHHSVRHVQQDAPLNISVATPGQKTSQKSVLEASPTKSLKRKQSRADLDELDRYPTHGNLHTALKQLENTGIASQLPRPTSTNILAPPSKLATVSSAKRVKRTGTEVAASSASGTIKTPTRQPHYPDLSNLTSPTQASLARTPSIKAATSKIPGPGLVRSPSKPNLLPQKSVDSPGSTTALLSRSPSKAAFFERAPVDIPKATTNSTSPLLTRSPTKPKIAKKEVDLEQGSAESKSPAKHPPLLARSPLKGSVVRNTEPINGDQVQAKKTSTTPLLYKSPTKISMPTLKKDGNNGDSPNKSSENGLLGRFQLLRSSPMKSILRSPQRLYSNDPAKVAAGTHLATPPKFAPENQNTGQKRVDFSSSTKARYERAQSELSSTPSKGPTPSPKQPVSTAKSSAPTFAAYPTLPADGNDVVVTPQKRRQTAVPGDFTFKAGEHSITFGQSPNAPVSATKRPSTIRHVSVDSAALPDSIVGKKRKFDIDSGVDNVSKEENDQATTSDKENETENERPTKRLKKATTPELPSAPTAKPTAKPAAVKRPTLGVKPKKSEAVKEKKPSVISKARLAALSQPKRRT